MFFLDTWVLVDFFCKGDKYESSREIINKIRNEKAVIDALVITELKYALSKKAGPEKANKTIYLLQAMSNLKIVPVVLPTAKLAADLRLKYYDKQKRAVALADMVHLATAILTDCKKFYTGDKDFEGIGEIETSII